MTLQHYRYTQKHEITESKLTKEEEEEKERKEAQALEVLEEAHRKWSSKEDPPLTASTVPPYDPEKPVGESKGFFVRVKD